MSSSQSVSAKPAVGKKGRFEHAFAIIRFDEFALPDSSLENCVAVTAIMPDIESAEREVERLNKQAAKGVRYLWQTTRLKQSALPESKWSPENRISERAKDISAEPDLSLREFLESIAVPDYIWKGLSEGGLGFPAFRVFEVCKKPSEIERVQRGEVLASILASHDTDFSEVVGVGSFDSKNLTCFAFRVFDDLCQTPLRQMTPLKIVQNLAERFGLEISIGGSCGKFILEKQFDIPRILRPRTPEGQVISVEDPAEHFVLCTTFKLVPPKVEIALAFCIDTDKYGEWLAAH
ncbi:MAG TPA: hypothetical protein VNH11_26845 [Pirellulales bacterium]|nr:hypothetical protein [Pirellulales bacterium]